jgi:hypothetical protein
MFLLLLLFFLSLHNLSLSSSSKSSLSGGALYYLSSSSSSIFISDSYFHHCFCSQEEGRGGALYLHLNELDFSSISLSSLSFSSNFAKIGNDIFLLSSPLSSIIISKFQFALLNGISREFSLYGKEQENNLFFFSSTDIDLYLFLLGYRSSPFFLHSVLSFSLNRNYPYCGIKIFPCSSLSYLLSNKDFSFDQMKVNGMSEIIIMNEISLSSSISLHNILMKSEEEGEGGKIEVDKEYEEGGKEYLMKIEEIVLIQNISFPFSSSSSQITSSFFLINSNSFSILHSSFFIKDGFSIPSPFPFSLFSHQNGNLSLFNCTFFNLPFNSNPFFSSLSSPSSFSPSSFFLFKSSFFLSLFLKLYFQQHHK